MSQAMQRAPEVDVMQSEKMICVECFRSNRDREAGHPCQNPRCYFYLCTPIVVSSTRTQDFFQPTDISESFKFNKEVGYDRKSRPRPYTSDNLSINPSHLLCQDNMWGSQPMAPAGLKVPQMTLQKSRSKSVSNTGGGRIRRLLSGEYQTPMVTGRGAKLFHSRMMSMPEYTESLLIHEGVGDLVEDAFSPLTDYGERIDKDRHHFGTPDTDIDIDSGISSPFGGRTSNALDWLDCPSSKQPSTSVTSPIPMVSSASATTSAFDMTQLKMEMTKVIDSQMDHSLAVNGRGSPESLDMSRQQLLINNVATVLGLGGLINCSETYSRKIFIGGLPPDIDEDDIKIFFMRFGSLTVDWPHKNHSKACIPPKGYAFILFKTESSVHKLLLSCLSEGSKHFIYMPSSNLIKKKVQIRPWYIADSYHSVDTSIPIDPRKAVFVGGVPRPLRASELAEVMTKKYGNVAFIAIDSDSDLKYPKGAACVVFSSHASYIAAVSARFMQLNYGALDKKIEIKPYVLDGQMCDECNGVQCGGKPAPFFCGSVTCLQYYCEHCWATAHSMPGRQNHRPLLKDIGDKARFY